MKTTICTGRVVVEVPSDEWERKVKELGVTLTEEQRKDCLPRTVIFNREGATGGGCANVNECWTEIRYIADARKAAIKALKEQGGSK